MATIGLCELVSGVLGALAGGVLADRIGARRATGVLMLGIGTSLTVLAAMPEAWPRFAFLAGWATGQSLLVYAYNAATLGFFMTLSNPAIGATQFAIYMAGTNLTYAWTAPLSGWMADTWGYRSVYAIAALVQVGTFCYPLRAERRFRDDGRRASG
jgi:PAT family beta-lactamase induction signal transducer AmpG